MDIVINAIGMPFNGETIKKQSLGGSESAAYYLARSLADNGHRVVVFTTHPEEGEWDGVKYVHAGELTQDTPLGSRFTFYALNTPHDVLIAQRHPLAFHKDWASKINIWQCHDLALHRHNGPVQGGLPRIDFTTGVSRFHADQISEVYGIKGDAIRVVPNGVDPALYTGDIEHEFPAPAGNAPRLRLLYQSRPERGLIHLVRPGGIMDRLREVATLEICGYENTTDHMRDFYAQLRAWADALPNVTWRGALTKKQLADLQRQCDAMCYPTEFEEVSCITAMEAMHAGLPFLSSKHAALPETCEGSGSVLLPLKDDAADEDAFVNTLTYWHFDRYDEKRRDKSQLARLRDKQIEAAASRTWQHATAALLHHITQQFITRRSNPDRVIKHCIEHSDIGFLDWYLDRKLPLGTYRTPIALRAMEERATRFEFIKSKAEHEEHYEKWEGVNCDRMAAGGLDIASEVQSLQSNTRFRGILQAVAEAMVPGTTPRVLEFGCAHGHITLALARHFKQAQFTGVDFMRRSVGKAVQYAQQLNVTNAEFSTSDLDGLDNVEGLFDVIVAAEVIEHIYDYRAALERLRTKLKPGGLMVFTTPIGRWEWSGHDDFKNGREHLHHFERDDWKDILRNHPEHSLVYAPFAAEETGGIRGSWVVSVRPEAAEFAPVDYERKLTRLAPRETVSLCMIVRNGEHTLGKALSSLATYVDEMVIAIDPTTNDNTRGVLDSVQAANPWLPVVVIDGLSAMRDGFDAARNLTVDRASGDWIVWMDSDEECPSFFNAWRLLRPSNFNAYATPQIHYSAQPAQVLTTDYPARLFRNRRGVRFYGLVHEHPEDVPGKSVTPCMMANDVQFLHAGYVTEGVRRARYHRNLPLLMRDIEAHPDRILNKFLLLRDIAQGIGFDRQRGIATEEHLAQATHGVHLMHTMIDSSDFPLRMVLDGLQYYSVCNEVLGVGFLIKFGWGATLPGVDTLSNTGNIEARVHNRDYYFKLINRIAQEATQHYESHYA